MRTIFLILALATAVLAQNSITPGKLHIDPPTLENLGFWWPMSGDTNRNGKVNVEYRRTGETAWHPALPLLRIGGEQVRTVRFENGQLVLAPPRRLYMNVMQRQELFWDRVA